MAVQVFTHLAGVGLIGFDGTQRSSAHAIIEHAQLDPAAEFVAQAAIVAVIEIPDTEILLIATGVWLADIGNEVGMPGGRELLGLGRGTAPLAEPLGLSKQAGMCGGERWHTLQQVGARASVRCRGRFELAITAWLSRRRQCRTGQQHPCNHATY